MSGKTEFVMPSAAEQLRAEEAMLRIDWDRLHALALAQAESLTVIAEVAMIKCHDPARCTCDIGLLYRSVVGPRLGIL